MNHFLATIPRKEIAEWCERRQVRELSLFGSVLREDFGPESDVDVLVAFSQDAEWGLWDHVQMQQELRTLLRRNVDLISKRAVERSQNWLRRREILNAAQILFSVAAQTPQILHCAQNDSEIVSQKNNPG
jgi:predicted nucleotidyltransferase